MSNAVIAFIIVSAIMLAMIWSMTFMLTSHAWMRVRRNVMRGAVVISMACMVIVAGVAAIIGH